MKLVPRRAYLTAGSGTHEHELVAFELALREAGIAAQNLVTVSSILPPGCPLIERSEGEAALSPGGILHVVMSRVTTREPQASRIASIGIARPDDPSSHGFIAERAAGGEDRGAAESAAIDLAGIMLASSQGVIPPGGRGEQGWSEVEGIASTDSISALARGAEGGRWSVGVACCVLLLD